MVVVVEEVEEAAKGDGDGEGGGGGRIGGVVA